MGMFKIPNNPKIEYFSLDISEAYSEIQTPRHTSTTEVKPFAKIVNS